MSYLEKFLTNTLVVNIPLALFIYNFFRQQMTEKKKRKSNLTKKQLY